MNTRGLLAVVLALLSCTAVLQKTSAQIRLTATSHTKFDGTSFETLDSSAYIYSPNMGYFSAEINEWDFSTKNAYRKDNGTFVTDTRYSQVFDANKRITEQKTERLTAGIWINTRKLVYTYNAQGRLETKTYQSPNNGGWINNRKNIYQYNSQGSIAENLQQKWTGTVWENEQRVTTLFDAGNKATEIYEASWISGVWDTTARIVNTYSGANHVEKLLEFYSAGVWERDERTLYTHDIAGNIISNELQRWNGTGWDDLLKHEYSYDGNNNKLTEVFSFFDNGSYKPSTKQEYTYDNNNFLITRITDMLWNENLNNFEIVTSTGKIQYYYKDASLGLPEEKKGNLNIYPSPAGNEIFVDLPLTGTEATEIILTDMQGHVIKTIAMHPQTNIRRPVNISELPAGNYIISVVGSGYSYHRPFVKL